VPAACWATASTPETAISRQHPSRMKAAGPGAVRGATRRGGANEGRGRHPGTREVKLIEQDVPRVTEPTHVKLCMLDVGVCGTDRDICAFQYGIPPAGTEHLVIGHESLGEIVEVGPAASRLKRGDLVIPMVRLRAPTTTAPPAAPGDRISASPETSQNAGSRTCMGGEARHLRVADGAVAAAAVRRSRGDGERSSGRKSVHGPAAAQASCRAASRENLA